VHTDKTKNAVEKQSSAESGRHPVSAESYTKIQANETLKLPVAGPTLDALGTTNRDLVQFAYPTITTDIRRKSRALKTDVNKPQKRWCVG